MGVGGAIADDALGEAVDQDFSELMMGVGG